MYQEPGWREQPGGPCAWSGLGDKQMGCEYEGHRNIKIANVVQGGFEPQPEGPTVFVGIHFPVVLSPSLQQQFSSLQHKPSNDRKAIPLDILWTYPPSTLCGDLAEITADNTEIKISNYQGRERRMTYT